MCHGVPLHVDDRRVLLSSRCRVGLSLVGRRQLDSYQTYPEEVRLTDSFHGWLPAFLVSLVPSVALFVSLVLTVALFVFCA